MMWLYCVLPFRFHSVNCQQSQLHAYLLQHSWVKGIVFIKYRWKFDNFHNNILNFRCWVSGWGKNDFNGVYQTIQKEVDVPVLDTARCQSALSATRLGSSFVFDGTSFICAGGEPGKDACTVSEKLATNVWRLELCKQMITIVFNLLFIVTIGWRRIAFGMRGEWTTFCRWISCMGNRLCWIKCTRCLC